MMESVLKRIERNRKERDRWIALVLCLSMIVSLGVFSGLRMDAIAKTYTRVVLECPYMEEGAERVVHTHNADCYDEYGNLTCTLPELEAHTHSDACYLENTTLVCGLEENSGHRHTDDCYTAVTTLACDLEENEGHQHTGDCYTLERGELLCDNTDEEHEHTDDCYVWNEVLSCGMEAGEGAHLHSEDCYRTEWILTCGMEEGEGAHTHTDDCYLTDRVLICDKPEIVLHTHTDDCYQKNDDGSIYVDEDGYAWLICGQPEIIEHVHDADCFAVYELDDGEPEEIAVTDEIAEPLTEDTDEAEPAPTEEHEEADDADAAEEKSEIEETDNLTDSEETKDETKDNTKDDTEDENKEETESTDTEADVSAIPMPAQSFEKLAGGIRVSVEAPEGAFPENTRMSASPVNGNSLKNTVSDAINGEVLEVQAVDIKFYDAEGNEIEPATPIRVAITPWASAHVDQTTQVVHIDKAGDAEVIEQAADAEPASEREVVFDADSFSIYAIVYSVSFEYEVDGQVFTSSVPGAREIMLSDVLKELNITAEDKITDFMSRIADVSVSAADVLSVTAAETDWTICALKASEDVAFLTVTMQDGAVFSIAVKADGATEVTSENEIAVISTVNDRYLPENATALAEVLDEEKSGSAIAAVQQAATPAGAEAQENTAGVADAGTKYQVFSIGLENVDATAYEGFNVSVTLPEDAVVGKDFQLYQIREDETVNLTESLEVTGEPNENGLQNVSGFTFKTDDFADFVLSYSIETNYTAFDGKTFKIALNYGPEAEIPEGAALKVEEILPETESYAQYLNDSVTELGVKSGAVSFARFFDIEIQKDGEKIEPKAPVSVTIQMMDLPEETGTAEAQVIHFGEQTEVLTAEAAGTDVSFETGSFSVYGVLYTVDFHYEVNGQTFEFSIPGGGFISLEHLIEVLGINVSDATDDVVVTDEAIEEEYTENSVETAAEEPAADPAAEVEAAADAAYEQAINLNNVPVSEETRAFVAEIAAVEFSSPELMWTGKVEEESTVGALKEANGLEVEYSANLTEEQIAEINAQTVEAGDWALVSVRPFVSEESLTVMMENGDSFTIRVTDGQIRKTVIDAKGDTWEIMVTYGDDAQIPDGAELKVKEILPEDEEYELYYQQSLEKVGVVNTEGEAEAEVSETDEDSENTETKVSNDNYAHIFDIQIWSEDHEIQPASDVSVSIKLLDAPKGDNTDLQVIHFGRDGLEVMELAQNDEQNDKQTGVTELSFVTDEFSVYTVVDVNSVNLANTLLNGPYSLVTGIAGDPGATTGYSETYDGNQVQDYFTIIVNAQAMMDTDGVQVYKYIGDGSEADNSSWVPNVTGLAAKGVHAWTDSTGSYVGGSPTQWFFEQQSGNNYKIYTFENGRENYVFQSNEDKGYKSVGLTTNEGDATAFTVDTNSDGTVLIHSGNWYLYNNTDPAGGWNEWVLRNYLLKDCNGATPSGDEYKFRLCKESDDFDSFAAQKVSASAITTNANYLIYRKFEDTQGNEALYALAHDGTFVRVYDGGDTVYWRETDKNIYWNYQMDGNYPVLFTQDPVTHEPIFINPNHSTGQTLSTTAVGLTLIGKDNGEYSTAIECWDQTAYDYAGLHVTVDNSGTASLSTGTRVAGTSDEFLFAVASQMPGATAEIVDTVDSDSLGIKITMFDYGDANGNYAAGDKLSKMTAVAGSAEYTPHAAHALVKAYLESGLPSSTTNGAMTGLFTADGTAVTAYKENVNHLFLQSYYDENGTFRYRSEDNYAYLPFDAGTGTITGTDFTVYRQAATPYTSITSEFLNIGHTYYYHGHFMPYNDIDMNNNLSRLMNQYGNAYDPITGEIIGEIPLEDGRTYEDIYGVQGIPNFYTGMKMEANFTQPRDGKLDNGDEMIFKFTGDDDMWVYIDDVLVLDIGGIHEPLSGTINFATGVVTNPTGSSLAGTTTLREIFMNVLNDSSTPESVKEKIRAIQWDGNTFADYTNHSFSAFYMERGAGASNLDIQFNLKVVLTNQFTVQKEIPEDVDDRFDNQVYKFRATYMDDGTTEKPLHAGIENVCTAVVYKDKEDDQGNPIPVSVDENGYFYLRAGEAAVFMMADESIRYNVKEVEIDDDLIEQVDINGQQVTVTDGTAEAGYAMVEDRTQVTVVNHPKTQNLLITKHLTEDSAPLVEGENPVFEFRVYLETTVTNENGTTQRQLVPYSYAPYYLVKEVDGETHYFTLTGVNNAPVDKGTTKTVCSTTGRSGSINSIPPEYTIIIPDLVDGTNFYVEERRDNIPEGYEFVREELTPNTYDESTLIGEGASAEVIDRVLARDEADHQEFDPSTVGQIKSDVDAESHVYNRKPAVIITVEKEWDPAPEDGTSVTVELHRYAKITKGTISVTLYDNNEAPIEGAEFELYKDGEATGTKVTTNVNGIASVSGLEAGTYKLVQLSTPAGYSMDGHTTETKTLTVVDNVTTPQTLSESLTNTALVTAGKVTLTVTDSGAGSGTANAPIAGATFTLYKNGAVYNTGYTSNDEGKVVVGNLGAGEYYFVQTGTTADYNLPNVTRTENFTVVENPGVTQEFSQSMTNSLKGKGTVSLTLLKDSEAAISSASFQLKSGSTVLETGTTGSDGTLSFSTELYEGTYTVHQVDTGSAGDDYATAADQNVTIEANSVTTQQPTLTFTNEEAAGNVTVEIWTAVNNNTWGQDRIRSFTQLKAETTYYIQLAVPENNIKNGDSVGITTGFVPESSPSGITSINNSDWTSSGDPRYYVMSFTPQQNNTTYRIAVVSMNGWGFSSASAILVDSTGTPLSRVSVRSKSVSNARTTSTPTLRTLANSKTATRTNASPASAPEGYAEDSTFEAIEITLPTNGSWQYTFDAQDKFDANGDPYYYYIVETACSDDDYWIDSYTGDLLNDVGTITVKNVKEKTGSIQVKKSFSGVDALPAGFQITNTYNSEIFTVANASGSGTTEDPYVWTLSGIPSGTIVSFTESGATVNGYNLTVTSSGTVTADSTVAAIAVAGSTVTADLVNTYELKTTEITLKKVDKDDLNDTDATLLKGAAFTLSKYESDSYQGKDLSWGTNGSKSLSDDKNPDGTYTLNGVFTFDGLTVGYYKIEETCFPAGYVKLSSDPTFKVEANASNELIITILNNPNNLLKLVDGKMTIVVGNTPGVQLPQTGGIGTNLFTVIGGILSATAGAILTLTSYRRRKKQLT